MEVLNALKRKCCRSDWDVHEEWRRVGGGIDGGASPLPPLRAVTTPSTHAPTHAEQQTRRTAMLAQKRKSRFLSPQLQPLR